MVCARPRLSGKPGCVRSSACTWLFSSQHNSPLGWVHVQTNDVGELLFEAYVIGDFERLVLVGLEAVAAPNPRDRGSAGSGFFGHGTRAPVGGRFGLSLCGQFDDPLRADLGEDTHHAGHPALALTDPV